MPWIDEIELHSCPFPQYEEGQSVRKNGELWACPGCNKVYSLVTCTESYPPDWVVRPGYAWQPTVLVYVPPVES